MKPEQLDDRGPVRVPTDAGLFGPVARPPRPRPQGAPVRVHQPDLIVGLDDLPGQLRLDDPEVQA